MKVFYIEAVHAKVPTRIGKFFTEADAQSHLEYLDSPSGFSELRIVEEDESESDQHPAHRGERAVGGGASEAKPAWKSSAVSLKPGLVDLPKTSK